MLFDRITLASAYEALKVTELNEGTLSNILFNKTAYYGTKTQIRFKTVAELRQYINLNFPFQMLYLNCQCGVCDESMWQLLSFNLQLPNNRYVSFINRELKSNLEDIKLGMQDMITQHKQSCLVCIVLSQLTSNKYLHRNV